MYYGCNKVKITDNEILKNCHSWQKVSSADEYCLGAKALTENYHQLNSIMSIGTTGSISTSVYFICPSHSMIPSNHHDNVNAMQHGLHKNNLW